jgi:hypothetical protein
MAAYMDELVDSSGESQVVGETRGIRGLETQMESLAAMVRQESEHYPPVGDYLELLRNFPSSEPDPVSENWRRQLCEWCYDGTCVQQGCWLPTDFRAVCSMFGALPTMYPISDRALFLRLGSLGSLSL